MIVGARPDGAVSQRVNGYTRNWWRPVAVVTTLLLIPICARAIVDCSSEDDPSPDLDYYLERGIPTPTRPWRIDDYVLAIETLRNLPDSSLPRSRSQRSGQLFEKLVSTERKAARQFYGGSFSSLTHGIEQGSLDRLYTQAHLRGLRVDCELVVVRTSSLEAALEIGPTLDEHNANIDSLREEMVTASISAERQTELNDLLTASMEIARAASHKVAVDTVELAELLLERGLSDEARQLLTERMGDLLPALVDHLTHEDRRFVASRMRAAADEPANSQFKQALVQHVETLMKP